jgi:hypothetical protein
MGRNATSLNREKSRFKPQPTVLVICEDSKSSKQYLEDASRHFKTKVFVKIVHCKNNQPQGVVKEAIKRQNQFEFVFCVIDRDTHDKFDEALISAKASQKIKIITSYPCYEFWLLLHFIGYNRKPHTPASILKELRKQPGLEDYDKGKALNIFKLLEDNFDKARHTSRKVINSAIDSGEMNPSTQLHELIDEFERLSKLQLIKE